MFAESGGESSKSVGEGKSETESESEKTGRTAGASKHDDDGVTNNPYFQKIRQKH